MYVKRFYIWNASTYFNEIFEDISRDILVRFAY